MRKIVIGLLTATLTSGAVPRLPQTQAQAAPAASYTYMQIFYYGSRTTSGFAFMNIAPAFHGQTEIKLDEPNMMDMIGNLRGTVSSGVSYGDSSDDPRYQEQRRKEAKEQSDRNRKSIEAHEKRAQQMRDQLLKTLNTAAAEGWEVVEMSGYGEAGLSYLLRHAK